MKPLSKSESAVQNDQAIETRRVARSIVWEPELNLKPLDSLSVPTGISRSNENPNIPTEQSDYARRLEVLTVWVLIAVLVVFSCGALYVLWSKASGGW